MVTLRDLAEVLRRLESAGLRLEFGQDGELAFVGETEPPADIMLLLRTHRGGLALALRRRRDFELRVEASVSFAGPVRRPPAAWLSEVAQASEALELHRLEVLAVRFERWARGELRGDEPAWISMRAANLGGAEVLVVLDEAVRLPPELERQPTYTTAEVLKLRGVDPRVLRAVHLTKDVWPTARVVRSGPVGEEG